MSATVLLLLLFGGCNAVAPCLDLMPSPDGGDRSAELSAQGVMERIGDAETRYYGRNRRYGDLKEIEPNATIASPYSFLLIAHGNHYQLTATPLIRSCTYCCLVGLPRFRFFYTDESRILRYSTHCRAATASSPQMYWHD